MNRNYTRFSNYMRFIIRQHALPLCLTLFTAAFVAQAQTTQFTYQGKLTDGGMAANSTYDMIFRLFDDPTAGSQIGSSVNNPTVQMTSGIFTVQLDFGAAAFSGADRYLEINIRPAGSSGGYTQLLPRQKITSAPQSIRSLNAANADNATNAVNATTATNATSLGGVAANQYVLTGDSRLFDARTPTAGSTNYIQNSTTQQTGDFKISGNGTAGGTLSANVFNATTQYSLGNNRLLSAPGAGSSGGGIPANSNTFGGIGAGTLDTPATNGNVTGNYNSFFGYKAGSVNTDGYSNSFYGTFAGSVNTTGNYNSFFGGSTGDSNTTGNYNSFFGYGAGVTNTTGSFHSFFGYQAGYNNTSHTTNTGNSFFGYQAGFTNTTGYNNNFFGYQAGYLNTTGSVNNFFGLLAGQANSTGSVNSFIGQQAGYSNTTGSSNNFFGYQAGYTNTTGSNNTVIGNDSDVGSGNLSFATVIGAGAVVSNSNSVVLGRSADTVRIPGNLVVSGSVSKGSGSFRIDHPLDPANKYLYHSFVESPDMMNIYNGNATTNEMGEATIVLPDYFEALNRDFRYQLTVIGQFAQAFVAEEIKSNSFKIKTDKPNVKVSWQVTGIRHDKFADDNRIPTTEEKPADERGKCLYEAACTNVKIKEN